METVSARSKVPQEAGLTPLGLGANLRAMALRLALSVLAAMPGAAAPRGDFRKACINESRLLCAEAADAPALEACLTRYRRAVLPPCRAALDGQPAAAPPVPSQAPTPAPASLPAAQSLATPASQPDAPTPERRLKAAKSFLNVDLPRADGGGLVWMAGCPTDKCLTVFVAPWCGFCRAATPAIRALREHLAARGVETRVVVGKDKPEAIREYAVEFGSGTILDPDWEFRFTGGLPHFFVSREGGEVVLARPGMRAGEAPQSAAARLGLP